MAGYVLDTSAIVAVLFSEEGAEQVHGILGQGDAIYLPFIAVMEVQYKIRRSRPDRLEDYMAILASWPAQVMESTPEWGANAALVKTPGGLSLADAWVAALALEKDALLVHKDREFQSVKDLRVVQLPYDPRTRRS